MIYKGLAQLVFPLRKHLFEEFLKFYGKAIVTSYFLNKDLHVKHTTLFQLSKHIENNKYLDMEKYKIVILNFEM